MTQLIRMRFQDGRAVQTDGAPCSCGTHGNATDASRPRSLGSALDEALKPMVEAKALATACLRYFGLDNNTGKLLGANERNRKLWAR